MGDFPLKSVLDLERETRVKLKAIAHQEIRGAKTIILSGHHSQ